MNFWRKRFDAGPVVKIVGQRGGFEKDDHMVSKGNANYSEILQIKNELNRDYAGLFHQNLNLIQKRVSKSQFNSMEMIKFSR